MFALIAVICSTAVIVNGQTPIYSTQVNEFTFGNVVTLTQLGGQRERTPSHMEVDQFTPGRNILYSDFNAMFLLNETTLIPMLLAGSESQAGFVNGVGSNARFNGVTGFAQISNNEVVIADWLNFCLRLFDRASGRTSTLAGSCTNSGNVDGSFENARFTEIRQVVYHPALNVLYLPDSNNRAIREVNLNTRQVSTLIQLRPTAPFSRQQPNGIALDQTGENLYVWGGGVLARVNIATRAITHLNSASTTTGFQDGALSTAKFDTITDLVFLSEETIMLVDSLNQGLRVVDLRASRVSSICLGGSATTIVDGNPVVTFPTPVDGDIETCRFRFPQSLLYLPDENAVWIGEFSRIRLLSVTLEKPGRCPRYGWGGHSPCTTDADCGGPLKCCYQRRFNRLACMYPVPRSGYWS